jgi:phage N-6-adenine-methyltransferase
MVDKVLFESKSTDWLTPNEIIDLVVEMLGSIDLDPCASESDIFNIPAKMYYTEWSNGLDKKWEGKVYVNPPYGKDISKWIYKAIHEYNDGNASEIILLIPARTDTRWFQDLFKSGNFVWCAWKGRLKFSNSVNSATFPSAIVYMGSNNVKFINVFSKYGKMFQ